MNRASLAVVSALLFAASAAQAADMPLKAPPPVPVVASWTGFYIGGDVGWDGARQSATSDPAPAGFGVPAIPGNGLAGGGFLPTSHSFRPDSLSGGLYAGYNQQFGNWLAGIEADVTWLHLSSSSTQAFQDTCCAPLVPPPATTLRASENWLASLRGRIGAVANNNWLLYVTGGAAWTHVSYSSNLTPDGFAFPVGTVAATSFSQNPTGYVVGGGVEYMFSHWIGRIEYLYYRFPGASANVPVGGTAFCPGCTFNINFSDLQVQTVRAGLSYKF